MEKMCFSGLFCGNSVRSSWTKFYPLRTLRISANFYEHRLTGSLTLCQFKSATERNPVYPTSVLPRIIINITHLRDGHDSRGLCAPVRLWKSLGHAAATLTDSLNTDSAGVVVVGVGRERRIKGEICQNGRNKSLNVENVVGRNLWGSSPRIWRLIEYYTAAASSEEDYLRFDIISGNENFKGPIDWKLLIVISIGSRLNYGASVQMEQYW